MEEKNLLMLIGDHTLYSFTLSIIGTEADNGFEFRNFTQSSGYSPKSPSAPTYYT